MFAVLIQLAIKAPLSLQQRADWDVTLLAGWEDAAVQDSGELS